MKNEIESTKSQPIQNFSSEQLELIKKTIMPGASNTELMLFENICKRTGLDPFARQIYATSRRTWDPEIEGYKTKWTYQTSIDGFRLIAQRSGEYGGQTAAYWCGKDGKWMDVWLAPSPPWAAKIGVYRKGLDHPTWAVATLKSYAQKTKKGELTQFWKKMADVMIAKCAEALALRKAFPQELSGIYTDDELQQAEDDSQPKSEAQKSYVFQGNTSLRGMRINEVEKERLLEWRDQAEKHADREDVSQEVVSDLIEVDRFLNPKP